MAQHAHTGEALAFISAHAGDLISATARAHERAGPDRLTHLLEAQCIALEVANFVGIAIQVELAIHGKAVVPIIAERIRTAASLVTKESTHDR